MEILTESSSTVVDIVATDSEWDDNLSDRWLSTTFAAHSGTVIFIRRGLPPDLRERLSAEAERLGVKLLYIQRTDKTDLLRIARRHVPVETDRGKVRLAFFFSPKDVEYALGWEPFREAIQGGRVRQRNALTGCAGRAVLRDLKGWAGKDGLAKFAEAMGVPMPEKTVMDEYKAQMYRGLTERPEDFLRYAVDDARRLLDLYSRFTEFVRTIQSDVLKMPDDTLWETHSVPVTMGRLVAETFRRWLFVQAGENADAVKFCDRKLGILDPDAEKCGRDREQRNDIVSRVRTPGDLVAVAETESGRAELKAYHRAKYYVTALGGAGVRWFASRPLTETIAFNALVQGGRCHNERPDEYATGPGLDVDIEGCYGASLRTLVYPVGLPRVWSSNPNDRRPTLGNWLKANKAELVPQLWTVTVSGPLSFEQDLLYSKLVKHRDIGKAAGDDGSDIPTDFVLQRGEVKNAIITSDLLDALEKVATPKERGELMKLEVVTAAAYCASDREDGPGEWTRSVLAWKESGLTARVKDGVDRDRRPHVWYGVPLEEFIGRLVDERKRAKNDPNTPPGLEQTIKLMINTLYGVFASRHFEIGNAVLANNITARARLGVWMVAKALGLRQTITDGGIYTPPAVPTFSGKKPSLDALSRPWEWKDVKRQRTYIPLPDFSFAPGSSLSKEAEAEADSTALAQVRRFWEPYGLDFAFTLSHKKAFRRAAYWSKSDYALLIEPGEEPLTKLRGKDGRKAKRSDEKQHPSYALLDAILSGSDQFPGDLTFTRGGILKVGMYRVIQASEGGYAGMKHLRPGDNLPAKEYTASYNNTFHPLPNERTYLKRKTRKRTRGGRRVELFEKHRAGGISKVHSRMKSDRL